MSLRVYTWKVGMSVLYRGVGPTLVGIHPYAGLKCYIYEELNGRETMQVTDAMLAQVGYVYPENAPPTKEAYYYRTIFEKFSLRP
ncbi:hypothetical protein MKW98_010933 [Papaver atlanticum]|uniref:Uncharacterized protein n=1 Tax=Papaver atlanticum TaxID=357466 RepID=A0AAD4XHU3_9MAGN|nr:hypothetical protein MKW98_010933 [Papaver atlanticum]